mgnify:CR=1 FL=1
MAAITTTIRPGIASGAPLPTAMTRARFLASSIPATPSTSVTTYYYRTTGGARASLQVPADLPLGAVVEIVVTA